MLSSIIKMIFTKISILVLVCLIASSEARVISNKWNNTFNDSQYYVFDKKSNFYEANQFCKLLDSDLVSIETTEEYKFIQKMLKERGTPLYGTTYEVFWTSGSRQEDNTTWIWSTTGEYIRHLFWAHKEPNNWAGNEWCLDAVYFRADGNFQYYDDSCYKKFSAICERKLIRF